MCGICGVVGKQDQNLVKRMCEALVHRGPDSDGFYFDEGVSLGMRRLKIIDLDTGDQPIYNEDKTICVVLNGEIYNFKDLREDLIKKGHRFYTKSDTEVIVHLYEQYKDECVKYMRGMFTFAVWDKKGRRLFIARDRIGIKPLYYLIKNGNLIFASELKALLKYKDFSFNIDCEALDNYLTFLYIPAPLTIFKDVHKLLPAQSLSFKDGKLDIKDYWKLSVGSIKQESEDSCVDRLRGLLNQIIKQHMISDVPLGALLSGGLDSSTVVGLMSKLVKYPVETFSIGFEEQFSSYNELEYSKLIANKFHTNHHEIILKPDVSKIIPEVVWHLDEPFADSSAILNYLISQETRKLVTVALSGIGGDEIFGGYPRYIGAMRSQAYERLPFFLRNSLKNISTFIPQSSKSPDIGGWLKRFFRGGVLSADERYLSWISFYGSQMKNSLYAGELKEYFRSNKKNYIHYNYLANSGTPDYIARINNLDIRTYLPDDLLVMADKMSMAHSLELRVPFCDHILVEELVGISFDVKLKGFKLKSLLKKVIKDLLPDEIINKRKQGFMVPLADWLKGDLRDFTKDILNEASIKRRGVLNWDFVSGILEGHFQGKKILTHQIWSLIVFELWARQYLDSKG